MAKTTTDIEKMISVLTVKEEAILMTASIVFTYKQAEFDLSEAAKIVGVSTSAFGAYLNESGILVRPTGKNGMGKRVSAAQIAQIICTQNRVSPLRGRKGA